MRQVSLLGFTVYDKIPLNKFDFFFFFCEVCIINYHVQIIRSGASVRLETEPSFPVMLINFQVFQAYNGCWIDHLWSHQVYQVSTQVVIKSLISAVLLVLFMALWKIRKRLAFSSILFFSLFMPLVSSVWCFFYVLKVSMWWITHELHGFSLIIFLKKRMFCKKGQHQYSFGGANCEQKRFSN